MGGSAGANPAAGLRALAARSLWSRGSALGFAWMWREVGWVCTSVYLALDTGHE